jgi:hypothetical protein
MGVGPCSAVESFVFLCFVVNIELYHVRNVIRFRIPETPDETDIAA